MEKEAGKDVFKGQTYLLAGATYEKLKYKQLSIKYYCKAKQILGKGRSFPGLVLKALKWYKKNCPGYVAMPGKRKKKGGGFLGVLLGLAILGGVAYLVLKKSKETKKEEGVGEYSKIDITFKVRISAKKVKRRDVWKLDGIIKKDVTNIFNQTCNTNTDKSSYTTWKEYEIVKSATGLGTFKLLHRIYKTDLDPHCWNMFIADWSATVSYEFTGGRDPGIPVVDINFPEPDQTNGWVDETTCTIQMPTARRKGVRVIRSGTITSPSHN